jgi:hypothetical protein
MLDPEDPDAPKYWRSETGDELKAAVIAYIRRQALTLRQIQLISAYLMQWICSPVWDANPTMGAADRAALRELRNSARLLRSRADIDAWIGAALNEGIDPL